ncbi:hypothetical protein [Daejeonella oryzae]|uniref:hypothetical protein n=1 Tax=Daejeonella oryzae TaxID=1122943 RepID=UPI00041902BE|nr:hypothetical protein [Daejeonella oryzae]
MKFKLILFILISGFSQVLMAQNDSSAYQIQRKKINGLLNERSEKFGQYDQSLIRRTGIFGLKTKKDMQRSNDILTDIVLTDNSIFKELKILLDYKDLEKTTIETKSTQNQDRIGKYMETITKVQNENERLKEELKSLEKSRDNYQIATYAFLSLSFAMAFLIIRRKKLTKD